MVIINDDGDDNDTNDGNDDEDINSHSPKTPFCGSLVWADVCLVTLEWGKWRASISNSSISLISSISSIISITFPPTPSKLTTFTRFTRVSRLKKVIRTTTLAMVDISLIYQSVSVLPPHYGSITKRFESKSSYPRKQNRFMMPLWKIKMQRIIFSFAYKCRQLTFYIYLCWHKESANYKGGLATLV